MKSWSKIIFILLGTVLLIVFLASIALEYKYTKDESSIELTYKCLAIGIVKTLNLYYITHGAYPGEAQWANEVLEVRSLSEFGCGPFESDAEFLEKGFIYEIANKNEVTLYLRGFAGNENNIFELKFGKTEKW